MEASVRAWMRIEVHIEELILEGFAPGDRWRVGAAVQEELGRLFSRQGVPPGWAARVRSNR